MARAFSRAGRVCCHITAPVWGAMPSRLTVVPTISGDPLELQAISRRMPFPITCSRPNPGNTVRASRVGEGGGRGLFPSSGVRTPPWAGREGEGTTGGIARYSQAAIPHIPIPMSPRSIFHILRIAVSSPPMGPFVHGRVSNNRNDK